MNIYHGLFDKKKIENISFDIIVISHVLEHIAEPVSFLNDLKSYLSEKGKIFIEVPNDSKEKVVTRINYKKKTDSHLTFFTPDHLTKLLEKVDFRLLKLSTVGINQEQVIKAYSQLPKKKSFLVARINYLFVIFKTMFLNPNFKYYKENSSQKGNWIRGVFEKVD